MDERPGSRTTRRVLGVAAEPGSRGFTLIELVMAVTITAFVFAALSALLIGGLRALSVAKTRAQANELATQGIEDLQRYDFNDLGFCPGASDPAPATTPAGLGSLTTVVLPNCTSGSLVYSQPCSAAAGVLSTLPVPRQSYVCTRNNIAYTVSRYVRWTDGSQTGKRLAVYVSWKDTVGNHQVAQESSLRSPNAASVIGIPPPQFVNVSVTAPNPAVIAADGTLQSTISFAASTSGLSAGDQVFVTLAVLTTQPDGTVAALPQQFALTSADGNNWSVSIPGTDTLLFGAGSQFVTFTEVRSTGDGKANSKIASTTLKFCPAGGCPSNLPVISAASVTPTSVDIDASGVLQSTFTVNATTANVAYDATVTATLQTQTGAASLQLQPASSCSGSTCDSWTATFAPGSINLRFLPGNQLFYITALQPVSGSGATDGSSAVATTGAVSFA